MIAYPDISPVAFEIFGFRVHWYGIMYLLGIGIAWIIGHWLLKQASFSSLRDLVMEKFISAATIGVIIGGRLGYVLFYKPLYYAENPLEILLLWKGGMSFHGGLLGVIVSLWVLARLERVAGEPRQEQSIFLRLVDFAAVLTPPGLGLGRLGNFINRELPGRVASPDLPWAMNFEHIDSLPRHPSQLYQMAIEGILLTALMLFLSRTARAPGWLAGAFLVAYSLGRFFVEFFREPDSHLGLLFLQLSMGQWLSIPMFLLGLAIIYRLRISAWLQALAKKKSQLDLKALLQRLFVAKPDVSRNKNEETFAEKHNDKEQVAKKKSQLDLKALLQRLFVAKPDVSWNENEETFAEKHNDEEQVASGGLDGLVSKFFSGGQEADDEEELPGREVPTRQQKRRMKKKRRKK